MSAWTAERVNQLAPDAASAKAGQGLASARKWVSCGTSETALFGECQGSGAKPYQVRVDLDEPAFKCSCPSRKFPCKHAIGLLLMYAAGSVAPAAKPAWVEEWMAERAARAEKKKEKAEAPPKPVDVEAQAKRKEKRLQRVGEGLAALKLWALDLVRSGIASAPTRGYAFFDEQARRLVDAQAPGAARRIHILSGIASSGAGWQGPFLEQLASVFLLIRAFERLDKLPDDLRETALATLGIQRPQEDVLQTPPVADRWAVIAQEVTVEERLRARYTWLWGERTRRPVLMLDYAHGTSPLDASLSPGHAFDGEICLFPGHTLRGVVKTRGELKPVASFEGPLTADELLDQYATMRAANPWLEGFAACVRGVTPARIEADRIAIDAQHRPIRLTVPDGDFWTLSALSGGHPIDLVGFFDGRQLRPLSAAAAGEFIKLRRGEEEATAA